MRKRLRHNAVVLLALLVCLCATSVAYGSGPSFDGFDDITPIGETTGSGTPVYEAKHNGQDVHVTTVPITGTGTQAPAAGDAGESETFQSTTVSGVGDIQTSEAITSGNTPTPGSSGSRTVSTGPTIVRSEVSVTGDTHYVTYSDDTEVVTTKNQDGTWYETVKYADGTKVTRTSGVEFGTEGSSANSSYEDWVRSQRGNGSSSESSDETGGTKGMGDTPGAKGTPGTDGHMEDHWTWVLDGEPVKSSVVTEVRINPDGSEVQKGFRVNPDGTKTEFTTNIPSGHFENNPEWVPGTDGTPDQKGEKGKGGAGGTSNGNRSDNGGFASITIGADGKTTVTPGVEIWGDISKITTTPGEEKTITTSHGKDELYYLINHDQTKITTEVNDDGYTKYVVETGDGEKHTIDFGTGGGEQSWYSIVKDENGEDKLLKKTLRKTIEEDTEWTDLGYEWAVQNFTDDSSPYYGRSVTRTLPIPQASRGGTDKGGLLRYGEGKFEERFVHYGEHQMTVTHYFNVDVYRIEHYESCSTDEDGTEDCESYEVRVYDHSYIQKDPPQYYRFHVPLICLDCVPPAPGVQVCIGGGCDCVGDEYVVCDIEHSNENYLQIENRVELER